MYKSKRFIFATLLAATALLISACAPQADEPTESQTSKPSASVTASATPTPTQAPATNSAFPCSSPAPTAPAPSAAEIQKFKDVITSGNSQAMVSNSCDTVTLILSGSSCCGPLQRDSALSQWGQWLDPSTANWTFDVDPALVATWRANFYGQYLPEGSLIAVDTNNNKITSIIFDGNVVTGLFFAYTDQM